MISPNDSNLIYASVFLLGILFFLVDIFGHLVLLRNKHSASWIDLFFDNSKHDLFTQLVFIMLLLAGASLLSKLNWKNIRMNNLLKHQNLMLKLIRDIGNLANKDNPVESFLEEVSRMIVHNYPISRGWIARFRNAEKIGQVFHQGYGDDFGQMETLLLEGKWPSCVRAASQTPGFRITKNPKIECPDCPLAAKYRGEACLIIRLHHQGVIMGLMSFAVPQIGHG